MDLVLNPYSAYSDIANHLGFKTKSYEFSQFGKTNSINLDNVINYEESKSIRSKSLINDINAGFCSPGYACDDYEYLISYSILFLENFRRVMTAKHNVLSVDLTISCLVEGSVFVRRWLIGPTIVINKDFRLEGSEYKVYTRFSITCNLSTAKDMELVVKDRGWFDYISLVFQECINRNIQSN